MLRLASSRNVQWYEACATNWVYSRAQDLVKLSTLKIGYFDERIQKSTENCFGKNDQYFWQKNKSVVLDGMITSLHPCLTF